VEITIEKVFDCERERVWAVIGNPERVDWVPSASDCVFDGSIRRFRMEGAGQLAEKIVLRDEDGMVLKYSVIDSPAVNHHLATISLKNHEGNKTRFSWAQEFEPAQLEPFIRKGMEDSLVQLDSVLDLS
tara:strand:+ start:1221 stop:1607 length:387 start_codon:yes stop_codon:yes gene_type:complete